MDNPPVRKIVRESVILGGVIFLFAVAGGYAIEGLIIGIVGAFCFAIWEFYRARQATKPKAVTSSTLSGFTTLALVILVILSVPFIGLNLLTNGTASLWLILLVSLPFVGLVFYTGYAGLTLAANGDHRNAIRLYTLLLKIRPRSKYIYFVRGLSYGQVSDFANALQDYKASLQIDGNYPYPHVNKVQMEIALKDYEAAHRSLETALALPLAPLYHALLYVQRAGIYLMQNKLELSLNDVDKGLTLANGVKGAQTIEISAASTRALVYYQQGEYQAALTEWRNVRALQPDVLGAIAGEAIGLSALGQEAEAVTLWKTLAAQDRRYLDFNWLEAESANNFPPAVQEKILSEYQKLIRQVTQP